MKWYVRKDDEEWYIVYTKSHIFKEAAEEFDSVLTLKMQRTAHWHKAHEFLRENIPTEIVNTFGTPTAEDELDILLEEVYKERRRFG